MSFHGFEPTVRLFRCFYVNSKNKGWMSFSKRQGSDAVCYTKLLDSLKGWNDHFFWMDAFACPALFPWHTDKSVSRDVIPKSSEFSQEHYATIVAYPAPFHKYPEPFLCLVGMSRNYTLDENTYPQFLHNDDKEMDLLSFIHTTDPTKVRIDERQHDEDEPKLLETTAGRVVSLLPVVPDRSSGELEASVEKLFGEGGSSEQVKQGDSASGGHGVGIYVVAETSVEDMALAQLKRRKKRKTKVADPGEPSHPAKKLRDDYGAPGGPTVGGVNIVEAEVDSVVKTSTPIIMNATTTTPTADPAAIAKEKLVGSSVFGADSPSAGGSHPIPGGFSDCSDSDFLIGGIRTVIDPDFIFRKFTTEVRMCAEYNIKERRKLNCMVEEKDSLLKSRCEEIESLKTQLLVNETEAADVVHLRAKASKFEIVEKSLRDETQVLKERNATLEKEKSELEIQVTDLAASVKVREQKVVDLDAVVTSVKLQNDSLDDHEKLTVYENCMSQLEKFQDEKMEEVNEMFDTLCADFVEIALHLEEKFYPHLLTTISGGMWLLTRGMKLVIAKCLNSTEYLCALRTTIGKAIEKDASVETIMNLLRLEDALTEKLGLVELQPHVDQLMVPIHHSLDQRVIGASALSLSLDVSSCQVRKIKENIANHVSALRGVFVPLSEPLSAMALEGTTIPPISTDDYEVVHTDGQEGMGASGETVADESVVPLPNVSDVELDISECDLLFSLLCVDHFAKYYYLLHTMVMCDPFECS
nr:transposase (putative), gypsy type [Tanacetum cinerariifolium]